MAYSRYRPITDETGGVQGVELIDDETGAVDPYPLTPDVENVIAQLEPEDQPDMRLASNDTVDGVPLNPMEFRDFQAREQAAEATDAPALAPGAIVGPDQVPRTDPRVAGLMPQQQLSPSEGLPAQSVEQLSQFERPELPPEAGPPPGPSPMPTQEAEAPAAPQLIQPQLAHYRSYSPGRAEAFGPRTDVEQVRKEDRAISKAERQAVEFQRMTDMSKAMNLGMAHHAAKQEKALIDAKFQQDQAALQAKVEQRIADSDRAVAALKGMSVDSKRFWKEAGTGGQIMGAIAMALGAFGAALTGGPNGAQAIIDDAIERDINEQLQDIENGRVAVRDAESALAAAYRQTGDLREAYNITKQAAHERARDMLDEAATMNAQLQSNADYMALRAGLEQREQDLKFQRASMYQEAMAPSSSTNIQKYIADTNKWIQGNVDLHNKVLTGEKTLEGIATSRQNRAGSAAAPGVTFDKLEDYRKRRKEYDSLDTTIREIDAVIPAEGDIPGYGLGYDVVEGVLPYGEYASEFIAGEEGRKARQAIGKLVIGETKKTLSGTLSNQDMQTMAEIAAGKIKDPVVIRQTLENVRAARDRIGANLAAATPDEVVEEFERRGGTKLHGKGGRPDIRSLAR